MTAGPFIYRVRYKRREQRLIVRADSPAQAVELAIREAKDRTGSVTAPEDWVATRLREIGPVGVVK